MTHQRPITRENEFISTPLSHKSFIKVLWLASLSRCAWLYPDRAPFVRSSTGYGLNEYMNERVTLKNETRPEAHHSGSPHSRIGSRVEVVLDYRLEAEPSCELKRVVHFQRSLVAERKQAETGISPGQLADKPAEY